MHIKIRGTRRQEEEIREIQARHLHVVVETRPLFPRSRAIQRAQLRRRRTVGGSERERERDGRATPSTRSRRPPWPQVAPASPAAGRSVDQPAGRPKPGFAPLRRDFSRARWVAFLASSKEKEKRARLSTPEDPVRNTPRRGTTAKGVRASATRAAA